MINAPNPSLRVNIDTAALAGNWRVLDKMSGAAATGAAIKANCYGLGIDSCLPVLRDAGATDFFVAHWSEVADAIVHVPPEQVSVLHGPMTNEEAAYCRATGVRPVINSPDQAQRWIETGGGQCHLMVDTGINRLGAGVQDLGDPAIQNLEIDILMSHLASADEESELNRLQLTRFKEATTAIKSKRTSLANSAGVALGPEFAADLTRPGLALYGGVPRDELSGKIAQVAFPQAAIIQTRQLAAGDTVGYNATFTAEEAMPVGVVSLGYADGYLRAWSGTGALENGGRKLPILGKVSMDMVVVDLRAAPDLREADWLDLPYDLPNAARQSGLSQYELLTVLGRRFQY